MDEYVKHNFVDGQVLHAQALNEMDDAIGEVKSDISNLYSDKQSKLDKRIKQYKNVTVGSGGYVWIDSYSNMGLSSNTFVLGMNIRGWSGASTLPFSFAKSQDGMAFYLLAAPNTTISELYVEYWIY